MSDKRAAYRELSKVFPRLFDQTDAALNVMRNIMDRHGVHATELVLADRDEIAELRREISELQSAVQRQFDTFEAACASKGYVGDAAMARAVNVEPARVRDWREIGRVPAIFFHKLSMAPDKAAEKREEEARKRTVKEAGRAARAAQREEAKRQAKAARAARREEAVAALREEARKHWRAAPPRGVVDTSMAKRLRSWFGQRPGQEEAIKRAFEAVAEEERAAGAERLNGRSIYEQAMARLGLPLPGSIVPSHVAHFVRLYESEDPGRIGVFRRIEWPAVPFFAEAAE